MKKLFSLTSLIILCCIAGCSDYQKTYELSKIVNPINIDFSTITNVQISESQAIQIDPINYKQNANCQNGKCEYLLLYKNGVRRSGFRFSVTTAYSDPQVYNCSPLELDPLKNSCNIKNQFGYEINLATTSLDQKRIVVGCYLGNKCTLGTNINSQGQRVLIVNLNTNPYPSYSLDGLNIYQEPDAMHPKSIPFYYYLGYFILGLMLVLSFIIFLSEIFSKRKP